MAKKAKIPVNVMRKLFPELVTALGDCLDFMEAFRASGDAGNWEWRDDEYTKGVEVLNKAKEHKPQGNG